MSTIASAARLAYLRVSLHEHGDSIFDASCSPRPRFCIGLLLEGKAEFRDCSGNGNCFTLSPGEVVFVPITTRYVSHWIGDVCYISLHFDFEYPGIFTRHKSFKLQKYIPENVDGFISDFRFMLEHFEGGEREQLEVLSRFFGVLGTILPRLETGKAVRLDERLARAVEYIEKNYTDPIDVDSLAAVCNMSSSRFYPAFKEALGTTPIDYLNHFRVGRAMALLINSDDMSIESISDAVGFESSTYFRRVFKRITGKSPKEYRRISAEI